MTPEEIEYIAINEFNMKKHNFKSFDEVVRCMKSIQQRDHIGKIMDRYHSNWSKAEKERTRLVIQIEQSFNLNACKQYYKDNEHLVDSLEMSEDDLEYIKCLGRLHEQDFYHELDNILDEESDD